MITITARKLAGEKGYRVRRDGRVVGWLVRGVLGWVAYSSRDGQRVATMATREQAARLLS